MLGTPKNLEVNTVAGSERVPPSLAGIYVIIIFFVDVQKRATPTTQGHGDYLAIAEISSSNPTTIFEDVNQSYFCSSGHLNHSSFCLSWDVNQSSFYPPWNLNTLYIRETDHRLREDRLTSPDGQKEDCFRSLDEQKEDKGGLILFFKLTKLLIRSSKQDFKF